MKIVLDDRELADRERWQRENFKRQVEKLETMFDWALREIRQTLEWIDYDADLTDSSHSDAASRVVSMVTQLIPNVDLRGLVATGADLSETIKARRALSVLKDLHPDVGEVLDAYERERMELIVRRREDERAAREQRQAERCEASVYSAGFGGKAQCSRKGKYVREVGDAQYRVCSTHRTSVPFAPVESEAS